MILKVKQDVQEQEMTKVELFEIIRREHFLHGNGIRKISRERGIHRRMVRQALDNAIPPNRKNVEREAPVLRTAHKQLVDKWLEADKTAPRKQRHTARRIWQRLRAETDFTGAESTIRRFVGRRRRELGLSREAFVPLSHEPGKEAEVDWYEADVDFPWGRERVYFFQMRSCYSGREFNIAFPRQTQRAFLEGHVLAFKYFGGVFERLRYDNLKSAVKRVLRGRRRVETDKFTALRSHYLFDSEFCRVGLGGAHEKGGVEGGLGRFRRTHLVPVPQVESYEALNRLLLDACFRDDSRRMEGRVTTIIEDWEKERDLLRSLPKDSFPTEAAGTLMVNRKGCVKLRSNQYSVPIRLVGRQVEYRLHTQKIELLHSGEVVAVHPRLQERHGIHLKLDHYVELLWYKPGALNRSLPLRQARERGEWPASYDRLFSVLEERFNKAEAARQMLAVLMLHRDFSPEEVFMAVELAFELGCFDAGAISVLVRQLTSNEVIAAPLQGIGSLSRYDRPVEGLEAYDALLSPQTVMAVH